VLLRLVRSWRPRITPHLALPAHLSSIDSRAHIIVWRLASQILEQELARRAQGVQSPPQGQAAAGGRRLDADLEAARSASASGSGSASNVSRQRGVGASASGSGGGGGAASSGGGHGGSGATAAVRRRDADTIATEDDGDDDDGQ
jgi:hypothetical protein